jgi:microcystin-dependent protein
MTQVSDYQVPAHPSGLDMRTQLNNIVLALLGDNCGPTTPTQTYPGMWWGDTTAKRWKHRTNADDGWVDVGPLDDILGDFRSVAPPGTVIMWWGDGSKIPAGWVKCDGQNGTPNMTDRVPVGAGGAYASGAYGGANAITISASQMPVHSHGVSDGTHAHSVADPGHAHGIGDPGHAHSIPNYGSVQAGSDNGGAQCPVSTGYSSGRGQNNVNGNGTGIWIGGSGTGIGIYGAYSNISIQNAGGGAAVDVRQPYMALWFLMKK